jgi:hypothetical protein
MKKLLLAVALLVLPVVAFADDQREILLTSDGTLFIAEPTSNDTGEVDSSVAAYIRLTIVRGEETTHSIVPGTLASGLHKNPALAYDNASKTLFVFWQRSASLLHSELLFETMNANAEWGPVAAFGNGRNMRENLRIAVTRKADAPTEDGKGTVSVPQINVHAVWWETDSWDGQESAQYAMMTVENGAVVETSITQLLEFVDANAAGTRFVTNGVPEVFKHPSLFPSTQQDSVRPSKIVGNARVHIPVGRSEGSTTAPRFSAASNSRIGTIIGGDDRIALYTSDENNKLRYVLYKDGKWSEARAVQTDAAITRETAINAVRRLIEHE